MGSPVPQSLNDGDRRRGSGSHRCVVLVIVAHPDDETLGAGGTIARLAESGSQIHCLSLTTGVGARRSDPRTDNTRRIAFANACHLLGCASSEILGFEDQQLDAYPFIDLVQAIETWSSGFRAFAVLTHSVSDLNRDHRLVCEAVLTAFRPYASPDLRLIASFEVSSSTEVGMLARDPFRPSLFVDIENSLNTKLEALNLYGIEIGDFPHPRSAEAMQALARYRGTMCGYRAAEAFDVLFWGVGKQDILNGVFKSA